MYVVRPGDTLWDIAQRNLGNGARWHELQVSGWDGIPEHLPVGAMIHFPGEAPPPAPSPPPPPAPAPAPPPAPPPAAPAPAPAPPVQHTAPPTASPTPNGQYQGQQAAPPDPRALADQWYGQMSGGFDQWAKNNPYANPYQGQSSTLASHAVGQPIDLNAKYSVSSIFGGQPGAAPGNPAPTSPSNAPPSSAPPGGLVGANAAPPPASPPMNQAGQGNPPVNNSLPDFMNPANLPVGIRAFGTPNGQSPVAPSAQALREMSPSDKGALSSYWQDVKGVQPDDMMQKAKDEAPIAGAAVPTNFQ